MSHQNSDRSAIYGVLAVQLDFIEQSVLAKAIEIWQADHSKSLDQILFDEKLISAERHSLLNALVDEHVRLHSNDVTQSLAAALAVRSTSKIETTMLSLDPSMLAHTIGPSTNWPVEVPTKIPGDNPLISTTSRFGKIKQHAQGGLGIVYLAKDREILREVALKEIQERHADNRESRARFIREAEITGALEHPGIVPVYGLGAYGDGRPYYAMRFVRGESFREVIATFHKADENHERDPAERTLSLRKLIGRFIDVCDAIAYAHSRGVIHRDLKPANIMIGQYGETLVVDWGLAKTLDKQEPTQAATGPVQSTIHSESLSATQETLEGSAVGTPQYMSPEQAAGWLELVTTHSDIYSLGATFYSLLTGKPPIPACDIFELLDRVKTGRFPQPSALKPGVPKPLEAICLKAMSLDPAQRYPSARELADDLDHWLADERVSAFQESFPERLARWSRRHRAWVQSGAAALVLIMLVSLVSLWFVDQARRQEEKDRIIATNAETAAQLAKQEVIVKNQELEHEKRAIQNQLVQSHIKKGLDLCENGFSAEGILWLTKALQITPADETETIRKIRSQLNSWRYDLHHLLAIYPNNSFLVCASLSNGGTSLASVEGTLVASRLDLETGKKVAWRTNHTKIIRAIGFSTDDQRLVTVSADKTARVWNALTGDLTRSFSEHTDDVNLLAFHPGGKLVATASHDRTARLWNLETGQTVLPPLIHPAPVIHGKFTSDGRAYITSCEDLNVRIWNVSDGKLLHLLPHAASVRSMAVSPDNQTVVTGDILGNLKIWNAVDGKLTRTLVTLNGVITSVDIAFHSKLLLCTSGKVAQVWHIASGQLMSTFDEHHDWVSNAAFGPDGRTIVSVGEDQSARLWDFGTSRQVGPAMTLPGIHKSVFFASSDSSLITMDGSTIRRWGYGAFRSIPPIAGFPSPPLGGRVSPDAKSVYLIGSDYEIQFWDLATSKLRAHQVAHGALPNAVAFSRDSKRFATAGEDQTARLWNVETGSPMHLPLRHQGPVVAIDFRADGNQLITASLDKTAIIWDVTTGKAVGSPLIHPGPVYASVFSPDGKIVATSSDTNAYLWDASTGKPFAKPLSHAQSINQVQFNPNGKYLLTTAADHIVRIWDVETGQIHRQFACDSMIIRADFSPDGARIAVTTSGRFARVWDVATGQALTPLLPHRSFLWNPIFSQDGNIIITRQDDSSPPIVRDAGNGRQIGPALQTFWSNVTVAFSPDNQAILTCNNNALARRWPVPNPMDGDDQTIMGTFERATGLRLTDTNIARVLTADEWKALPQK